MRGLAGLRGYPVGIQEPIARSSKAISFASILITYMLISILLILENALQGHTILETSLTDISCELAPLPTLVVSDSLSGLGLLLRANHLRPLYRLITAKALKISFHLTQIRKSMTVIGIVAARKSHQSGVTVSSPPCPLKNAMPKKLETAVAGKKIIVRAAIVFIAALSFFVA